MILRRISTAIRRQDWFTVLIEIGVVVIGLLIGLQINNWNEARADRLLEAQYLENIADDISEEIRVLDAVLYALQVRTSIIDALFEEALGQSLPQEIKSSLREDNIATEGTFSMPPAINLDGLDRDYFLSYTIMARIFSEHSSTFKTLQATGDLGVINNRTLALNVTDYYATIENLVRIEDGTVRHSRDEAATIAKRHGLNPFGPNDYKLVLNALRDDHELAASLRALRNLSATNYGVAARAKVEAVAILTELAEVSR